ncbi:MAG: PilZ domain-containing protein [Geobacteraceae bacterium]|nr:PilZ domain-containing protein [Geobacteraceae bacterium]
MVSIHPTKTTNNTNCWKHLLGKTVEEIIPQTGEPFASYIYSNEEVYLYDKGDISTVVLRNGIVIRCDDLAETRRTTRVNPVEKIPVVVVGEKKISGYLKDLSIAGAAFHYSNKTEFAVGSRINISFALPIAGISRYFQISCRVHVNRGLTHEKIAVVLFDHTDTPWKKQLLSRYVQLSSIQADLGLKALFTKVAPPFSTSPNYKRHQTLSTVIY